MSSDEDFISQVCVAFKKVVEKVSGVTIDGWEREYRRALVQHVFDEVLGWEGYSKVGEIYDIVCFDDESFPIIVVETKGPGIELTDEIKEKLRKRIEERGSVKYGVLTNPSRFVIYEYEAYKLREVANINIAVAVGVAKKEFGLSESERRRILKLEALKRERLVWVKEEPDYFERTYKEVSVAKGEGVKLLTENLKDIVRNLTTVLMIFFDSYWKRADYSGKFLQNAFNDWLKLSMKDEEFNKGNETERMKIMEIFCRETAYVLLGRLLFTRICEDKGITETRISGKGLAESLRYHEKRKRENPYLIIFEESREEIKKYYRHLHELGFFDWWWISPEKRGLLTHDDIINQERLEENLNDSIKKMLRKLNRFDFTQVNRDILGDVYQGYLPPDERKRLGEFYTPKEVIEYILDAVGYMPENEIRGKKILDPACGSGSFLVEASQRLIERYRRVGFKLKDPDDAKQIIQECVNLIYGLDIHPFACFIAEMNLLFQLVDLYDVVREKNRYYELPRLNIYRTDSLMPPGESIELTEFFDNSRRKMLIEETKGADRVKSIEFDYVIGNPPYVRIQRMPKSLIDCYKEVCECASGKFDIYILFIERGVKWLKKEGKLGFICSNQFMNRDYGEKLRNFISEKCTISQILDFGDSGVFREVTNYPCVFILTKDGEKANSFKYVKVVMPQHDLLKSIRQHMDKKEHHEPSYELFDVYQSSLGRGIWRFGSSSEIKILTKIRERAKCLLKDICERIYEGLIAGANKIYFLTKEDMKQYNIEGALLKPIPKGKDVRRWQIIWDGRYLIYPHKIQNSNVVPVDLESYPNAKNYLFAYRNELERRHYVIKAGKRWYEIWNPRSPDWFDRPKIVTPNLSTMNNFAYDEGIVIEDEKCYYYLDHDCYGILPSSKSRDDHLYLLGLLNSKVLEFYIKHISPYCAGKYFRYMTGYLEQLPIKLPYTIEEKEMLKEIAQKVDQILQLKKQSYSIRERIRGFPNLYFEGNWSFGKLMDIAKVHLLKPSYKISIETIRTYPFKELEHPFREVSRIILATDEHIDFYSEEVASYVLEVLKTFKGITKRELLELKIPLQGHLKSLMYQYRKDKEQIVKNEKAVEELEKQIDDLVYKLYDITYPERRTIEEYLAKF